MEGFNSAALFGMKMRLNGELHHVNVNFPSDQQWEERSRARPVTLHTLSGGQTRFEVSPSYAHDLKLYTEIRQSCCNGAQPQHPVPDLDEFEASSLIEKLATYNVRNVTLGNADCEVELDVMVFETVHKLRIPTQRQIVEYRKRSHDDMPLPYGRQRLRVYLEPSGRLYDELLIEVRNYGGAVSLLHKQAVVQAIINALDAEGSQPNFH
jgi:hypothetical protein